MSAGDNGAAARQKQPRRSRRSLREQEERRRFVETRLKDFDGQSIKQIEKKRDKSSTEVEKLKAVQKDYQLNPLLTEPLNPLRYPEFSIVLSVRVKARQWFVVNEHCLAFLTAIRDAIRTGREQCQRIREKIGKEEAAAISKLAKDERQLLKHLSNEITFLKDKIVIMKEELKKIKLYFQKNIWQQSQEVHMSLVCLPFNILAAYARHLTYRSFLLENEKEEAKQVKQQTQQRKKSVEAIKQKVLKQVQKDTKRYQFDRKRKQQQRYFQATGLIKKQQPTEKPIEKLNFQTASTIESSSGSGLESDQTNIFSFTTIQSSSGASSTTQLVPSSAQASGGKQKKSVAQSSAQQEDKPKLIRREHLNGEKRKFAELLELIQARLKKQYKRCLNLQQLSSDLLQQTYQETKQTGQAEDHHRVHHQPILYLNQLTKQIHYPTPNPDLQISRWIIGFLDDIHKTVEKQTKKAITDFTNCQQKSKKIQIPSQTKWLESRFMSMFGNYQQKKQMGLRFLLAEDSLFETRIFAQSLQKILQTVRLFFAHKSTLCLPKPLQKPKGVPSSWIKFIEKCQQFMQQRHKLYNSYERTFSALNDIDKKRNDISKSVSQCLRAIMRYVYELVHYEGQSEKKQDFWRFNNRDYPQ